MYAERLIYATVRLYPKEGDYQLDLPSRARRLACSTWPCGVAGRAA